MKKKIQYASVFFVLLACLFLSSCKKDAPISPEIAPPTKPVGKNPERAVTIKINGTRPALDTSSQTYFFPISESQNNFVPTLEVTDLPSSIFLNNQIVGNEETVDLGNYQHSMAHSLQLIYGDSLTQNYKLVLTNFPIVQIYTYGEMIEDEPKILADFIINDPNSSQIEQVFTTNIGIEIRGLSSQQYDKKAYGFELWEDTKGNEKLDATLLDMRSDDDWILDAMFIDPARMRNRVTTDIWLDFQELSYSMEEPNARNGTNGKLVEVFVNQTYKGIYMLTERIDRKLLQLSKFENSSDFGLLYKAVGWGAPVTFKGHEAYDPNSRYWKGWEQKYPDPRAEGIYWKPLSDFVQFVVEADAPTFKTQVGQRLDLENAIDYFLLLNLIRADDNTGKNTYFAKYKQSGPFFIVPWDLDATWGLFWNGTRTSPNGILSNGLFDRLLSENPDNFRNRLKERWQTARQGIFSQEHILTYFGKYAKQLKSRDAISRERQKWEVSRDLDEELAFIDNWVGERLVFLDEYFINL